MQKLNLIITDMTCPNCVMRLESIEDNLQGVESVNASYQKQTMEVIFDESILSRDAIFSAIEQLGYSFVESKP